MRGRIGTACMVLGAVLLVGAAGLLSYNAWDNWRAGKAATEVEETLQTIIADEPEAVTYLPVEQTAEAEQERVAEPEEAAPEPAVSEAPVAEETAIQAVEVDETYYIGTLSIPALGLELPVMYEWSYDGLKIAPGRYSGSVETNDLVICGHNYTNHFGSLKYLSAGDTITFTDVSGNTVSYEVVEVITLQATAIEEMLDQEDGDWDLTLFTCTTGAQARVTVRCSRIE